MAQAQQDPSKLVAMITGASRGIGRAIALELASAGVTVAVLARAHRGRPDRLDKVVSEIELLGGRAMAVRADLRESAQVAAAVGQVLKRLGRIDLLVNNAGVFGGELQTTEVAPVIWRKVLATNLDGAFYCAAAVVPGMLTRGRGIIVNISSGAAVRTGFLNIAYGVSKAGLDRLTLGLHAEFGDAGLSCVSLSPPVTATETVRRLYRDQDTEGLAPPELTARALRRLLEIGPQRYGGQVVAVREFLREQGML